MSKPAIVGGVISELSSQILDTVRAGLESYKHALESVACTLLDEIESERRAREAEIQALRVELADVRYALRSQLRELKGREETLQ